MAKEGIQKLFLCGNATAAKPKAIPGHDNAEGDVSVINGSGTVTTQSSARRVSRRAVSLSQPSRAGAASNQQAGSWRSVQQCSSAQ
ncbi:hypothetical protein O988_05058 [Pseudogymnoascus sp. VKM F-3808]|nr:hypothetical protein O988_05058 [Pseudogymnoascus sp. VKM F-3808]